MEIKGYTYGFSGTRGAYRTDEALASMEKLAAMGCEWVTLAFIVHQERYNSTQIMFDYRRDVTDKDIAIAVERFHKLGLKVCLKPVINCKDYVWRARITFPDDSDRNPGGYWNEWFEHYKAFLCHYAEIATDTGCEMFCVGCEMGGTERKEEHWRDTIAAVKELYKGPLQYNTNHGHEEGVQWFDAVDYVGVSAYYPVAQGANATEEEMYQNWLKRKPLLQKLSEKWGKKILFSEVGIRSAAGCAAMPWDYMHRDLPFDEDEQANFYASCLRAFAHEPWFAGYFWWEWPVRLYPAEKAKENKSFCIYGKKAEQVLREWYKK